MGSDVTLWRASIGLYYNKGQRIMRTYTYCTYPLSDLYTLIKHILHRFLYYIRHWLYMLYHGGTVIDMEVCKILVFVLYYCLVPNRHILACSHTNIVYETYSPTDCLHIYTSNFDKQILLSGDIESNPGPDNDNPGCLSIIHQNIRSIRNKMDYIKSNFVDFDIICFTETHLSIDIADSLLKLRRI